MRWGKSGVLGAGPWAVRAHSLACLVLLALLAFVSVAHIHPATNVAASTDLCPVCVMIHSAAPVDVAAAAIHAVAELAAVVVPVAPVVVRPWQYRLFTRPPPDQV